MTSNLDRLIKNTGVALSLASLVLRIHPQRRSSAEAALTAFPGVECHGMSEDGRLIVTVEDAPGAAMSETLIAIHRIPEVLAATLAFEADDALLADNHNTDCSDCSDCSDSRPCEETPS